MPDGHETHAHAGQAASGQTCQCEQQTDAALVAIAAALLLVLAMDRLKSWWRNRKQPPAESSATDGNKQGDSP